MVEVKESKTVSSWAKETTELKKWKTMNSNKQEPNELTSQEAVELKK